MGDRVMQLLDEKRKKEALIKELQKNLSDIIANEIYLDCTNNDNISVRCFEGESFDMSFLTSLGNSVLEKFDFEKNVLLLLTTVALDRDDGNFLLFGNDVDLVKKVSSKVMNLMEGKGGGRNGKIQGKGAKVKSSLPKA